MSTWPSQRSVDNFYGNPRGRNGLANGAWESANLVRVPTPWALVTSWDGKPVRGITVHKLCSISLTRVLGNVWQAAGQSQQQIDSWGMNLFGGGYNFRIMRGGNQLSMHSWGCAVDFDPARNGFGDTTPNFANCQPVIDAFSDEGWTWGGGWQKTDGMHWQAADI